MCAEMVVGWGAPRSEMRCWIVMRGVCVPKRYEEHKLWLASSGICKEGNFWRPKSASWLGENKGL